VKRATALVIAAAATLTAGVAFAQTTEITTLEEYFKSLRPSGVPALIETLKSDEAFKIYAVKTLGRLQERSAVPALMEVFESDKTFRSDAWELRAEVAIALGKIKDERAVPFLVNRVSLEPDWVVRRHMAAAMGKLGTPACIERLSILVKTDTDPTVRNEAVKALGEIGTKDCFEPLLYAYTHAPTEYIRQNALEGLKKIKF
jgi:HEAT repeat protein